MTQVGRLKEVWRFPVKSMQGSTVDECWVDEKGLRGDRRWAMRDETREEIQWGKMFPQLMLCSARYRSEPENDDIATVEITFPDGATLTSDDAEIHAKLSELVGRDASLRGIEPAKNKKFYERYKPDPEVFQSEIMGLFAREPDEPLPDLSVLPQVLIDYVAVPGTFFDNEAIHLITTASIEAMREKNPAANWDIRRFRPNFYIETSSDLAGLAENEWVGKHLKIGSLLLEISAPTLRCGMTVRPQDDIEYDKSILRTVVKEGNQCLGVGAHVREPGIVRSGDSVELLA